MGRRSYEEKAKAHVTSNRIWRIWSDVSEWPSFDPSLEWANLNGPLAPLALGTLKPKGWMSSQFWVSEATPNKSFSTISKLIGATMTFEHCLRELDEQSVEITHRLTIEGSLATLYHLLMGSKLKRELAVSVNNLRSLAEAAPRLEGVCQ